MVIDSLGVRFVLYVSASRIVAAGRVIDRTARVRRMAEVMREMEAAHGSCDLSHLRAADFTTAEILAFADEARALLTNRQANALKPAQTPASVEANALAARARQVRRRISRAERLS